MSNRQKLYFLWDYDLTEDDVRKILHGKNEVEKIWMMSRILESAKYEDIWRFLTFSDVKRMYPKLKLKKPIKRVWDYALNVWQNQ